MLKKIVPVAIVALTALAAAGGASAHDVIVPRAGFDTALASLQTASNQQVASNAQSQSQSKAQSQNGASAGNPAGLTNVRVLDPSAIPDGWWKDR